MSTPLLLEVAPEIDTNPTSFYKGRGKRGSLQAVITGISVIGSRSTRRSACLSTPHILTWRRPRTRDDPVVPKADTVPVPRWGRGGTGPSKSWLAQPPKFSRTLDTLWSIDSQKKKQSKFDSTRCQILRLECTKFDFRWGSAPDPTGGAYSAPPDALAVFKGPTSNGRGEEEGRGRTGRSCLCRVWCAGENSLLDFVLSTTTERTEVLSTECDAIKI